MFIVFLLLSPCGILGQVWYLIKSVPDLCRLSNFAILCADESPGISTLLFLTLCILVSSAHNICKQNVVPGLDQICLTLRKTFFEKVDFEKKKSVGDIKHEKFPSGQKLKQHINMFQNNDVLLKTLQIVCIRYDLLWPVLSSFIN